MSAFANFQYVTLVAAGGTPVRLCNRDGTPYATTGNGAIVFSDGATLTNVTLSGYSLDPPLFTNNGTVAAPSLYFTTSDRGLYSRGTGDISFAANGARMASITQARTDLVFSTYSTGLSLLSDTLNETIIQGYDDGFATAKVLSLQKYGAAAYIGGGVANTAGGSITNAALRLTSAGVALLTGTGAPTATAPYGSLYMRQDTTALPYFNTDAGSTWQQLVGISATQTLTNKTFVAPVLGNATATTLAIGGATIGSNALAVTGTSLFNSAVTMGAALTYGGVTLANSVTGTGSMVLSASPTFTGSIVHTSATASAFASGPNGDTNPVFRLVNNTASQAAGLQITGAVAAGTVAVAVISSAADANVSVNAKGAGTITFGDVSTGTITLARALTYGGVTLANSVTGTGSMVLSAGATVTGTFTMATGVVGTMITGPGTLSNLVIRRKEFTVSGTYTPHASMVYCVIIAVGAGGGTGGVAAGSGGFGSASGGGGAGSRSITIASKATIGVSQIVTIGAGGSGGAAGNNNGSPGGDTSVGALCIGKGGSASNGAASGASSAGGAGGVAGTGDVTGTGAPGGYGFAGSAASNTPISGCGGSTEFGGGGSSVGGAGGAGVAGTKGAGASGAASPNGGSAQAGAAGGDGYIVIFEYCTA